MKLNRIKQGILYKALQYLISRVRSSVLITHYKPLISPRFRHSAVKNCTMWFIKLYGTARLWRPGNCLPALVWESQSAAWRGFKITRAVPLASVITVEKCPVLEHWKPANFWVKRDQLDVTCFIIPLFKTLASELFFFNFSTPVYKMWMKQEPNMLELWNKLHFEEKETDRIYHV